MSADGSTFTSSWSNVRTASSRYYRDVYGMRDVGIFFRYNGYAGYYLSKIDATTGAVTSTETKDTTYNWRIFQTRFNDEDDRRPVYLSSSQNEAHLYVATNVLTDHFTDTNNRYNFHDYPVDFGKYYAMEVRPGTCAQENGGSEDYDKLHINMMSLRDKAHVLCIDDSDDIYCGNGKWEEYNLEGCDDGNLVNGDGCSSACAVETRWTCTNVVNMTSVCTYVACGNSYLDAGEQCDDGNTVSGDGCSSTCQIEDCYSCSGVGATSCTKTCENGVYNTATYFGGTPNNEVCDEGATSDAPGCLDCCTRIETGYKCSFGIE
jgi:cysteine-rich repeat protein